MDKDFNLVEIYFETVNSCTVKIPSHIKKDKISEFIIDKIISEELNNILDKWFDFEITKFKIYE